MRTSVGTRVIVSAMTAILALVGCNSQPAEKADDTPIVEEETESKVDKTSLKEILDEVESTTLDGLTLATGTNLSNAHDEAVTVMGDDEANQAEVDSAERALISAFDRASRESESYAATSVDEFTVVDAYAEPVNSYGFFDMVIVVQNNTDAAKEFQGVDIAELDANGNIINYSKKSVRRVDLLYSVSYGEDFERAKAAILDVAAKNEMVLQDPEPFVRVKTHGASSIDIVTRLWVNSGDYWSVYFQMQEDVKKRFDEEGISIPYPQLDVHLDKAE